MALSLGCASAAPQADTELLWLTPDFPPISIWDGPWRDQGYSDRMLRELLMPALPGLQHRRINASTTRVERDILSLPNACAPALRRTPERAARMSMSEALFGALPVGLVLRRSAGDSSAPRSLAALLDSGLRLGVIAQRAHGSAVDSLLQQHAAQVEAVRLSQGGQVMLSRLARGHGLDAVIVYANELAWWERQAPQRAGQLQWHALQEMPPRPMLAHVACSNSPLGRQVIERVNALLREPGQRERFQALYEAWLDTAGRDSLQRLRRELQHEFWRED